MNPRQAFDDQFMQNVAPGNDGSGCKLRRLKKKRRIFFFFFDKKPVFGDADLVIIFFFSENGRRSNRKFEMPWVFFLFPLQNENYDIIMTLARYNREIFYLYVQLVEISIVCHPQEGQLNK